MAEVVSFCPANTTFPQSELRFVLAGILPLINSNRMSVQTEAREIGGDWEGISSVADGRGRR